MDIIVAGTSKIGQMWGTTRFLNTLKSFDGTLVANVAGIECRLGLKQQDLDLFVCDGKMFGAARYDHEFARTNLNLALGAVFAVLHAKPAFDDEEEFIFVFVMVPNELTLELRQLDVGVVQLTCNLRGQVSVKRASLAAILTFSMQLPMRPILRLRQRCQILSRDG